MAAIESICRICLKMPKQEYKIDDTIKTMLDVLLLKLELPVDDYAIICRRCAVITRKSCYFKLICIQTEIENVNCDQHQGFTKEYVNACQLCQEDVNRGDFITLEALFSKPMFRELIPAFMPEIKLDVPKNSKLCKPCEGNLSSYMELIRTYLTTEQKINTFLQNRFYMGTTQMLLRDIHESTGDTILTNENNYEHFISTTSPKDEKYTDSTHNPEKQTTVPHFKEITYENSSGITMYMCPLCSFESKCKFTVKRHSLIHKDILNISVYKCDRCTYKTSNKEYFERHKNKSVHKNIPRTNIYKCNLCTYETRISSHLKRHTLVHKDNSEVNIYRCLRCPYETKWKHCMGSHRLTHDKHHIPKMYTCEVCAFETHRKCSLDIHALIHKDKLSVKMYKCSNCTFETKWKQSFKKHQFTHQITNSTTVSDAKGATYKCLSCTFETRRKKEIARHSAVHETALQSNVYKCETCSYETYEKYQLTRHLRRRKCVSNVSL